MTDRPVALARLSSPEAARVLVERPGVLIPVGSLEQHGPNLALSTDGAIAEALAHRVAARYPRAILVTPVIPLGVSYQHRTFPGTISLSPATRAKPTWSEGNMNGPPAAVAPPLVPVTAT